MYGIYANIGSIFLNVTIYSSTMDPMGNEHATKPSIGEISDVTGETFRGKESRTKAWIFHSI